MSSYVSSAWGYVSSYWGPEFDPQKLKTAIKLAAISLNMQNTAKQNLIKTKERECLNHMLSENKEFEAKLIMETILIEQGKLKCFQVLKQLLMVLESRYKLIEESEKCPYSLKEAISSVIYTSMRVSEVAHLDEIKEQLELKFGKEFIDTHRENKEMSVNLRIVDSLNQALITGPVILENLRELASKNDVEWHPKDLSLYALTNVPHQADSEPNAPNFGSSSSSSVYPTVPQTEAPDQKRSPSMYPSLDPLPDTGASAPPSISSSSPHYSVSGSSFSQPSYQQQNSPPSQSVDSEYEYVNNNSQPSDSFSAPESSSTDAPSSMDQKEYGDLLERFARLKTVSKENGTSPSVSNSEEFTSASNQDDKVSDSPDVDADEDMYLDEDDKEENSGPKVLGSAVALYNFDASHEDELTAKEGEPFDLIQDTSGAEGDEWVLCRSQQNPSQTGYIPSNHLRISWL